MNLEQMRAALAKKALRLKELVGKETLTDEEKTEKRTLFTECTDLTKDIEEAEEEQRLLEDLDTSIVTPPAGGQPGQTRGQVVSDPPVYRSFGDQLVDIVAVGKNGAGASEARERLAKNDRRTQDQLERNAVGGQENRSDAQSVKTPEDGGGMVQTDYAFDIVDQGFNNGEILPKCSIRQSTGNSNALDLYALDEKSRKDGVRHGGIQVFTKREEEQYESSKAKFAKIGLKVNKITGLLYLTDEVMEDAGVLEGEVRGLFPMAFGFKIQDLLFRGRGNGEPLGIYNSKAFLSIAKEANQPANSILAKNISNMKAQAMGNGEFYGNRDLIPELDDLYRTFDGDNVKPLFKQTSMTTGILDGIPITFVEQAETLGSLGDLVLADWSQYVILRKGGIKEMESLHFKFDLGLKAIKWTMRIDGMSRVKEPLTPYKGTNKTSPFIGLAPRA
jgi:HK97 family phage major capsid protein